MTLKQIRAKNITAGYVTRSTACHMLGRGDGSSVERVLIAARVPVLMQMYEHPGRQDRRLVMYDGAAVLALARKRNRQQLHLDIGKKQAAAYRRALDRKHQLDLDIKTLMGMK